eukprot:8258326-Lingulodinium_polyedra.AAC.1
MHCVRDEPKKTKRHRPRIADPLFPFNACVARPVGKSELAREPEAQKARDKEWNRLRDKYVWDEENP